VRVLIAGGGTGGHLFPGMAVAEEVVRRGGEVLFVGTSRGLEARVVPAAGYALERLEVSPLKRVGPAGLAMGLARLPAALFGSLAILRRFRPDVVLGVGGYASGPLVMAAALMRHRTAVQEQNSVPGLTNRLLGRVADRVFIAFPQAQSVFARRKTELVGNPVRRKFLEAAGATSPSLSNDEPRLLVVGGSQGARAVNDLVLGAAEALAAAGVRLTIVHQTGAADADRCRQRYRALGLETRASVAPFIEDMAAALGTADLVIGRAGALTLAELAVVGRPGVLVPLPTAADDHQTRNAESFAMAGAAVLVDQRTATCTTFANTLAGLLADPPRRRAMSEAMRALARPNAARDIVDRLEALART